MECFDHAVEPRSYLIWDVGVRYMAAYAHEVIHLPQLTLCLTELHRSYQTAGLDLQA